MTETDTAPEYEINAGASRLTVQAFVSGMLASFGHSPTFVARGLSGTIAFAPSEPDVASLSLTVDASSLALQDDMKDKDRRDIEQTMNDKVLEVTRFPKIIYECPKAAPARIGNGQFEVTLPGELTLRNVTRKLPITARVSSMGDMLRAFGEFTINQPDFDVPPVSVAGKMLKIKDELKCTFEIVARK